MLETAAQRGVKLLQTGADLLYSEHRALLAGYKKAQQVRNGLAPSPSRSNHDKPDCSLT